METSVGNYRRIIILKHSQQEIVSHLESAVSVLNQSNKISWINPSMHDIDLFYLNMDYKYLNFKFEKLISLIHNLGKLREEMNRKVVFFPHNYQYIPFKHLIANKDKTIWMVHLLIYENPLFFFSWEYPHVTENLLMKSACKISANDISKKLADYKVFQPIIHLSRYLLMGCVAINGHLEENEFIKDYTLEVIRYAFKWLFTTIPAAEEEIFNSDKNHEEFTYFLHQLNCDSEAEGISCERIRTLYPRVFQKLDEAFSSIWAKKISLK